MWNPLHYHFIFLGYCERTYIYEKIKLHFFISSFSNICIVYSEQTSVSVETVNFSLASKLPLMMELRGAFFKQGRLRHPFLDHLKKILQILCAIQTILRFNGIQPTQFSIFDKMKEVQFKMQKNIKIKQYVSSIVGYLLHFPFFLPCSFL